MSTVSLFNTIALNKNAANPTRKPVRVSRASQLANLLLLILPRVSSHRAAMASLADGYDEMADRAAARGDAASAAMHRECGAALRRTMSRSA